MSIMKLQGFTASDANFMFAGKMLAHDKTFAEQNVQAGSRIIFTLKRKIQEQVKKEVVKTAQKPETPVKVEVPKAIPAQPVIQNVFGVQSDGTVKGLFDQEKQIEELNPNSIQILLDMGYDFDLVCKALRSLKDGKKYNPVGEVQKAIDWINDFSLKAEADIMKQFEKIDETHAISEKY